MVLFGLTVIVVESTSSNTAVSLLILTFLVPAVLFSAVAGVYVDRIDRRLILIATNVLRGAAFVALFLVGDNLALILLLNVFVSTVTVFFAPAEVAMIPVLVPRSQLLAANGIFTLTLNAAFALGFALLGPLVVNVAGAEAVILVVAGAVLPRAVFCITLPASPPPPPAEADPHSRLGVGEAERAVESTLAPAARGVRLHPRQPGDQLVADLPGDRRVAGRRARRARARLRAGDARARGQGLRGRRPAARVRDRDRHPAAQLVRPLLPAPAGHRGRPDRARASCSRRLSAAGPISRFLQRADAPGGIDLSGVTSLLAVVVVIAFFAGIAYGLVAIPAQTQLQEDLPEDVRGRVFGVLNMLVSVASFLPIIIVGPISDFVGTTAVIFVMAIGVLGHRGRVGADPRAAAGDRRAAGGRSARGRPDRRGARRGPRPGTARNRAAAPDRRPRRSPEPSTTSRPSADRAAQRAGPSDPTDRD